MSSAEDERQALQQRRVAIDECVEWVQQLGRPHTDTWGHVLQLNKVEFRTTSSPQEGTSSYRPPMVGAYARQAIAKGEVIWTVPEECVLSERHPLLCDSLLPVVKTTVMAYRKHIQQQAETTKPFYSHWDPYAGNYGRVIVDDEWRIMLLLTLLLYAHRRLKEDQQQQQSSPLTKAAQHFQSYLSTLPTEYSSLIFFWTEEEINNLKGTSAHGLAQRLRSEVDDNWNAVFQDALLEYLFEEQESVTLDVDLLHTCYKDAICVAYSRMHGLEISKERKLSSNHNTNNRTDRMLCPLVDLINGDLDQSSRVNVHVLELTGTHMALQATRDIGPGDELVFSYGQVGQVYFVAKFGFVPLQESTKLPQVTDFDSVYVLPPPSMVWPIGHLKWNFVTAVKSGKRLQRKHLIERPPHVTHENGSPFVLQGNQKELQKFRQQRHSGGEWQPSYLVNFHAYATTSLTMEDDLEAAAKGEPPILDDPYIEAWEPGALIMAMIDYRLDQHLTDSLEEDKAKLTEQHGNFRTGTYYRILERDLLHQWRHAIGQVYDVYGETLLGQKIVPLLVNMACDTCKSSLSPLKKCTQCKQTMYCSRTCQIEDWKGEHKQICKLLQQEQLAQSNGQGASNDGKE